MICSLLKALSELELLSSANLQLFQKAGVEVGSIKPSPKPIGNTKIEGFYKALQKLAHLDHSTVMTIAEEWLTDVAAPAAYGKELSMYDLLRHKLLMGDAEKFLVIHGSLSGIQNYLFDVKSSHALKQLRGRSFYMYLLQDAVVERAVQEFGVTRQAVLYSTGGTFCMLAPYKDGIEAKFEQFKKEITEQVFEAYKQNLILLTSKVAKAEELTNDLSKVFSDLHQMKNIEKYTPLCNKLQEIYSDCFVPQESEPEEQTGGIAEELGGVLGRVKSILVAPQRVEADALATVEPAGLGITYHLLAKNSVPTPKKTSANWSLIVYNDAELPNVQTGCRREYLAGIGASAQSLTDLFDKTSEAGIRRLGVLRMDVDNLGCALRKCYEQPNALAHYAKLSRKLDAFFKKELNNLWHKSYKETSVIVYSGGDDLFIVGAWDSIIKFAQEINAQYKSYFVGKEFTTSGGISLVEEKFPIIRAAEYSADEEGKAKNFTFKGKDGRLYQKNSLSIFGLPLRWDIEWSCVNEICERLTQLAIANEKMYRPILRRVLKYYEITTFENRQISPLRQVWLMTYDLDREIKKLPKNVDKTLIEQCKNDIITGGTMLGKSIDTPYHSLQLWAIAARLVELKIRNNNI